MPRFENRAALAAANRAAAAILGGYVLTLAFTAAAAVTLQRLADWSRGEATITAAMLAFAVYLMGALRAFMAPSAVSAWCEPLAAAAALAALAATLA